MYMGEVQFEIGVLGTKKSNGRWIVHELSQQLLNILHIEEC